jgi:hypothetical protein
MTPMTPMSTNFSIDEEKIFSKIFFMEISLDWRDWSGLVFFLIINLV